MSQQQFEYEVMRELHEEQHATDTREAWELDNPWAPTDADTRGDYDHDLYKQRELDGE